MQILHKDKPLELLRTRQQLKGNNINTDGTNNKILRKQHPSTETKIRSLLRAYTALNSRIISEYSLILGDSLLDQEHALRRSIFDLLRKKGILS